MSLLGKNSSDGENKNNGSLTLEQVMSEVNKALDTKLGVRFDDFKKTGLGEAIKLQLDPISTQMTSINETLERLAASNTSNEGKSGNETTQNKAQVSPEVNAQLRQLSDMVKSQGGTIAALQTAKEQAERRAEETDRASTIRTALTGMPFVNEKAAETAFSIVSPHVRRLDDGALVAGIGGDNFPVPAFTKDFLEKEHAYLFRSSGASGSGAPANGSGVRMGAKVDIDTIKPGMKPEDRLSVVNAIAAALHAG